ncbi:hypothetical protein U3A55_11410 [Salarchaeum sp. III]|uniref:hypothetical protein n=1 Tax=Salarchaeum sp. III TaxID=3107927 RepID=UPI002EDA2EC6
MAIDVCWTYEDIQVCTSSLDHFKLQTYDCITETTPELVSTTITAEEYRNGSFSTSFDFWFGVNPTTSCLWAGQEQAGICEKLKCDFENRWSDPVATPMPAAETLDSLRRFLAEDVDIDDVGSTLATGAGAAVFFAMAAQILTGNPS